MKNNNLLYICVKAASILRQPLLCFLILTLVSFTIKKDAKTIGIPTADSTINLENPNYKLLQNAILNSINKYRVKNKVGTLVWSDTLFKSADFHLSNMSKEKFFDHNNPDNKLYPDLQKRVKKYSGEYSCLSENLIQYFPFKFKGKSIEYNIKKVKTKYQYLDPITSKPLQVLTYNQLAEQIVKNWAASPPHKVNLLNSKNYRIGIAVNFPKYFTEPNISPVTVVSNFGSCN